MDSTDRSVTLFQGDCLAENGLQTIANESVDMICCDLPYGITENPWDKPLDLQQVFDEYIRIIKPKGAIVLFSCQPFTTDLINVGRKYFKYEIIWQKNRGSDFFNCNRKPIRCHENILVFCKTTTIYNPQKTEGKPYTRIRDDRHVSSTGKVLKGYTVTNDGTRFPRTIISFNQQLGLHTTQKPVSLLEWLILTYTNESDTVVDNTMGSGSCAIACMNVKRKFIGWELDQKYFDVATERVADLRQKLLAQDINDT